MIHYPVTIVDNFFDNPEYVVSLSKNAQWRPDITYKWPGERSQSIEELDPEFYKYVLFKYFLLFYSASELNNNFIVNGTSFFQRIPAGLELGWIHSDYPSLHTFMIYLTPNADPSSGTGLFTPRTGHVNDSLQYQKTQYYKGEIDKEVAQKYQQEHSSQFIQTVACGNVYNRCIGFDAHLWHGALNLNTAQEERLTLITFIEEIVTTKSPISNSKSLPFIRQET